MATEDPTLRERVSVADEIAIRWDAAMKRPMRFENEAAISINNSKVWYRINDALEELGACLVGEVADSSSAEASEIGALTRCTEEIWAHIRQELVRWAIAVENHRDADRAQAREFIAPYLREPVTAK